MDEFDGFEWDDEKSERCLRDRKFDFAYAVKLFEGDYAQWEDRRADYGEARLVTVGEVKGRILAVVWTPRGNISARAASKRERRQFYGNRETQQ